MIEHAGLQPGDRAHVGGGVVHHAVGELPLGQLPVQSDVGGQSDLRPKVLIFQPGQEVELKVDAFPYQRYGIVNATLDWVSPSAVTSPQGQHFVGLASLNKTDQTKRRPLALRVGMTGEARIVTGQRTMIEYAFEPIRQLRENMRN